MKRAGSKNSHPLPPPTGRGQLVGATPQRPGSATATGQQVVIGATGAAGIEGMPPFNTTTPGHISVMKDEVLDFLALRYPGNFLDMTFGGGGHTRAILEGHKDNTVTAIDCDPDAAPRAALLNKEYAGRFTFVDGFFDEAIEATPKATFDGVLFDLGVSSFQLDTAERGFSFRKEAPADMRMNPRTGTPAWKFIEEASLQTLETVLRDWAEEPRWRAVAQALHMAKGSPALATTLGLATLVGKHAQHTHRINPATRTFMGLRMAVNDEIGRLERALPKAFGRLKQDGVLAVISFHSVEDRVVKLFFREVTHTSEPIKIVKGMKVKPHAPAKLLLKKVGRPEKDEKATNARSRSAKLRVVQRISASKPSLPSAKIVLSETILDAAQGRGEQPSAAPTQRSAKSGQRK